MQNVIDFLMVKWNEEYTDWKDMPDGELSSEKTTRRQLLNEITDAIVILKINKNRP